MDRMFISFSFFYALAGLTLGIYMAGTHNHAQLVTHAHIMLAGFVVSFIYGVCHRLWLDNPAKMLAYIQFYLHHGSSIILAVGLFLLYGEFVTIEEIDPVLAIASIAYLIGMIMMTFMFFRFPGKGA